ncbi:MAG: NAD-dependent epimerase/dehydratase family protein, partial [Bacteroidota bacterium]
VGVYGRAASGEAPRPNTPYRRSKWRAEQVARAASVPSTVVRLPATLGPGTANWIGWVRDVAAGRFRLPGDGCARKTLADVADVVSGLVLAIEAHPSGATYDLAGPEAVPVGTLARLWAEGVGAEVRPGRVPTAALRALARLGDVADRRLGVSIPKAHSAEFFAVDAWHPPDAARRDLGYAPRVPIAEAVARTLGGFREAGWLPASALPAPLAAAP